MPKRLMGVRQPCASWQRLSMALEAAQEGPNVDEIVESQDQKLQEVKRNVFSGLSIPLRLTAEPPVCLATITELPSPALMVSTHYNDNRQVAIHNGGGSEQLFAGSSSAPSHQVSGDTDIDFSKPENLFLLEAPIDARKDQNMLKLACAIPKRTFMSRLLRRYPINRKRLAFIQRRTSTVKSMELIGNLMVSGAKGEVKEVTISCQVCGQKFGRQYQFQRHILIHPDPDHKKFLCQICGKRFNRADHLNRHAILHGDVKVQKCLLCGEEFDRASHLDRHRRKHHPPAGQQPSQTPPTTPLMKSPTGGIPTSPGYDDFLTSPQEQQTGHNLHLLAAVATPENLPPSAGGGHQEAELQDGIENGSHQHQQDMLGAGGADSAAQREEEEEPDRPYPCEVCGRKFIRATHLRRHMRIHTGEKPFACHICGRRYARGDYLRAHIHAHRRDKIHKCKHCGEVFHDLTRFADHCRLIHKDLDDQFGNPKPPPECSPPPPNFSGFLEAKAAEPEGNEITVVPGMNMVDISSSLPITLVTYPEPSDQDGTSISMEENPSRAVNHALPTPSHTPMTSPELQLAQLQALASHTDAHLLIQNGQLQIADSANEEVVTYGHSSHKKPTPISYVDSALTQYIYNNGSNHGNTYPTPQPSPIVDQNHAHSA